VLWAALFFLFAGSFDNWRTGLYVHIHNRQEDGRRCLDKALREIGQGRTGHPVAIYCATLAPYELSSRIEKACRHNVRFCEILKKE
jgi:hypothetical protein